MLGKSAAASGEEASEDGLTRVRCIRRPIQGDGALVEAHSRLPKLTSVRANRRKSSTNCRSWRRCGSLAPIVRVDY